CRGGPAVLVSEPLSKGLLPVDLFHDFRPAVDYGQHSIRLFRREHRHDARDPHLRQTLYPVKIFAEAEQRDLDGGWIAAGLARHLVESRQDLGELAARRRNPTIAITDGSPGAMRESAADMDRRMRLLHGFGSGDHRIEIDEFAMIFGLGFCPDFLH